MSTLINRCGELWIFDMDGTLFQASKVAAPAFEEAFFYLRERGFAVPDTLEEGEVTGIFGQTHKRIWEILLGYTLPEDVQREADRLLLDREMAELREGVGSLYPGVENTLRLLVDAGATLTVASNGQQAYVEAIAEVFSIGGFFKKLYTASGFQMPSKVDLVRLILRENPCDRAVMVGDRETDVEAGRKNGLSTVGCAFGYASDDELAEAHHIVRRFDELGFLRL